MTCGRRLSHEWPHGFSLRFVHFLRRPALRVVCTAPPQLREATQLTLRTGAWNPDFLDHCGYLCAATRRPAEAVTMWAAYAALIPHVERLAGARLREEPLRAARQALGSARARAAEERGAAM